jgi:uncharacterized damage-inducible protein DinB
VSSQRRSTRLALVAAAMVFAPVVVRAQQPQGKTEVAAFDGKSASHVKTEFLTDLDSLHSKFMALANAIPADKYSWRPAQGVRSVSEVFMHVAGEWYHWAPASMSAKDPAGFPTSRDSLMSKLQGLEKTTSKEAVIAELNKSWAHCKASIASVDATQLTSKYKPWGMTIDAAALDMAGDLHEHLGQLIAYSRSVGVKPPWSK